MRAASEAGAPFVPDPTLPTLEAEWEAAARRLPPLSRRLLVECEAAAGFSPMEVLLERPDLMDSRSAFLRLQGAKVLRVPRLLPTAACAAMRQVVDAQVSATTPSAVDSLPEYTVWLARDELEAIIGAEAVSELCGLPQRFFDLESSQLGPQAAPLAGRLLYAFARRYDASGRPWFDFHQARRMRYTRHVRHVRYMRGRPWFAFLEFHHAMPCNGR